MSNTEENSKGPIYLLLYALARIGDGAIFLIQLVIAALLFLALLIIIPFKLLEQAVESWLKKSADVFSTDKYHKRLIVYQKLAFSQKKRFGVFFRKSRKFIKNLKTTTNAWKKRIKHKTTTFRSQLTRITKRAKKAKLHPVYTPPELPPLKKIKPEWKGFFAGIVLTIVFIFIPYNAYLFVKALPNPHLLTQRPAPVTTQIFDREGRLLYEIYGDENRKPVPLDKIPDIVKQATIAIEDKEFYQHNGISISGITRAIRENISNKDLQGGSTITQQLIKNTLLTPEVSLTRKFKEVILAFWTEQLFSKDEILEMYLNQVSYGGTAWGIEAAAETYFGKSVQELNLAEAALLAGLPKAPSIYSPHGTHPELAKTRQAAVLRRMVEDGQLSKEDATAAQNVSLTYRPPATNIKAPHFVMYVKQLLVEKYGERMVEQGGLRVTTTLDLDIQEKVEEIVERNIAYLQRLNVGNGAALVTNPQTGEILAMVGSKDYFNLAEDGNVNVVLALRQPGSSIKLVNYVAALENRLTAATILDDTPVAFRIPGQPDYAPVNYDGAFHGKVPLRIAFASSYNIPAVRVLNQITVPTMIEMGKRMGISTWQDESRFGLSLTLGGGEVTMLDMAKAYGTIASGGTRTDLNPVIAVVDYNGKQYENRKIKKVKVIDPEISFIIADILSDNSARTPAFGPNSLLVIPGKTVSVKTGTTDEKRDNWTIGFTPSFVVTTWVGNNDNSPMNPFLTSGVTGAAPIWHEIMSELLKNKADEQLKRPENVVQIPCYGRFEYFVKGTEPSGGCKPIPKPSTSPSPTPQP